MDLEEFFSFFHGHQMDDLSPSAATKFKSAGAPVWSPRVAIEQGQSDFKVFLIGSAIHFVTAAVYRCPRNKTVDVLCVDPQNDDILG